MECYFCKDLGYDASHDTNTCARATEYRSQARALKEGMRNRSHQNA